MMKLRCQLNYSCQKNEVSQVTLKPSYGWGKEGLPEKGVGPNKTVTYEIKIISFEKAKESWQLDADAKLEQVKNRFNTNQHQEINCFRPRFSKTKEPNISRTTSLKLQLRDIRR